MRRRTAVEAVVVMIEAVVHRLRCDQCRHAWISPTSHTPEEARAQAALSGWTHIEQHGGWWDQCPRCVHRKKMEQRTA